MVVILLSAVFGIIRLVYSVGPFTVTSGPDIAVTPRVDTGPALAFSEEKEPPDRSSIGEMIGNLLFPIKAPTAATPPSVAAQLEQGRINAPDKYSAASGTVVDESGNAVPNAQVILAIALFEMAEMYRDCALDNEKRYYQATSNAAGQFEIDRILYAGAARIRAYAKGHTGVSDLEIPHGETVSVKITVRSAVTFTGRVLRPDGRPLMDALVSAVAFVAEGRHESGSAANLAFSDSNGLFCLAFPDEGAASLAVAAPGFPKTLFQDIPVGGPEVVELQLPAEACLRGRVTFEDGSPATGLTVVLKRIWRQYLYDTSNCLGGEGPYYIAEIGSDGGYCIKGIAPGDSFQVGIHTSSRAFSRDEDIGSFLSSETKTWDYVIALDINVHGFVYSAGTGATVGNCIVHLQSLDNSEDKSYCFTAFDGSYKAMLVGGPGTYVFSAQYSPARTVHDMNDDPYAKCLVCEAGGDYALDLLRPDPVTFPIRVVDSAGKPVTGAEIYPVILQQGSNMWPKAGETDAQGRFVSYDLPPNLPFYLRIVVADQYPEESKTHICQPGQQLPEETISLSGPVLITGIAIGVDGKPAANTGITFVPQEFGEPTARSFYIRTDEIGAFVLQTTMAEINQLELALDTEAGTNPTAHLDDIQIVPGQPLDLGQVHFAPAQ